MKNVSSLRPWARWLARHRMGFVVIVAVFPLLPLQFLIAFIEFAKDFLDDIPREFGEIVSDVQKEAEDAKK